MRQSPLLSEGMISPPSHLWLLAWALFALLPPAARAGVLYDSGGFETPRFVSGGNLQGQDAGQGPWVKDSGTGTALVQSTVVADGLQAVQITRPASATGDTRWAVTKPFTPTASENGVRVDVDLRVNQATFNPSDFGPAFGLEAYDATNAAAPLLIGSATIDATTGDVLYQQAGTGFLVEAGTILSRGTYHHLTLTVNFTNKTYTIFANGNLVRTEGFVDTAAARFTDAPLSAFAATGTSVNTGTGTAFFDNYFVASIPEPASGALMLTSFGILCSRRFRRRE